MRNDQDLCACGAIKLIESRSCMACYSKERPNKAKGQHPNSLLGRTSQDPEARQKYKAWREQWEGDCNSIEKWGKRGCVGGGF